MGTSIDDDTDIVHGKRRRVEFGSHGFDLRVVEGVAKKYIGLEGRPDLLHEVVSDATLSLFKVPADRNIDDPDKYAATATRRQVTKTLIAEQKRRGREEFWMDDVQVMRKVSEIRLATEQMVDSFLMAMQKRLTGRQRTICTWVLEGLSFKEIYVALRVDRKTVYNDLRRLYTLFQEFCDNYDPDPPPDGRRTTSSEDNRYCANDASGWGASWFNEADKRIVVNRSLARRSIERFVGSDIALIRREVIRMKRYRNRFHRRGVADVQEFKKLLLDLPAFRCLLIPDVESMKPRDTSVKRCDSLDEIVCHLKAGKEHGIPHR